MNSCVDFFLHASSISDDQDWAHKENKSLQDDQNWHYI